MKRRQFLAAAGVAAPFAALGQGRYPQRPITLVVPTATEAGLKGFELDSWFALY